MKADGTIMVTNKIHKLVEYNFTTRLWIRTQKRRIINIPITKKKKRKQKVIVSIIEVYYKIKQNLL